MNLPQVAVELFAMSVKQFATNLRCGKCVAAIAPKMNEHPDIESWHVDTTDDRKTLTVHGAATGESIESVVQDAGFRILHETASLSVPTGPTEKTAWQVVGVKLATFRPLLLVVGYLGGTVVACEFAAETFSSVRMMRHFMAGFFLAFSFFKMLDIKGFADSFAGYDLLASRSRAYALSYPFIELMLGIAFLMDWAPRMTSLVTLAIMLLGIAGVTLVLVRKREIQCACLGTGFNLPMSYVTFIENGVMIVMAIMMLAM